VDFPATFAALTGQQFESKTSPDTQNVLAALLGDSPKGRNHVVEHSGGLAMRLAEWKFIPSRPGVKRTEFTDTETGNDPKAQLYNLASDPGEMNNIATETPEKVKELAALLEAEKAKGMEPPLRNNPRKAAGKVQPE
jgi:arylsulfatase A-like enzyme